MKPYHYVACGLPNVYLVNGFEFEQSPYGTGVVIPDVAGLHQCIATLLLDKPGSLTGAECRFLRRELDLSQRLFGDIMDCDERTVRAWEREESTLPTVADRLLRHMYAETLDPSSTFEGLVCRLRELDTKWHEPLAFEVNKDWQTARDVAA